MRPEDVARLKQLEKENARLKRLLAERCQSASIRVSTGKMTVYFILLFLLG